MIARFREAVSCAVLWGRQFFIASLDTRTCFDMLQPKWLCVLMFPALAPYLGHRSWPEWQHLPRQSLGQSTLAVDVQCLYQ